MKENKIYPFNEDNIIEVKYTNAEYTCIEVLYVVDNTIIHPFNGEIDDSNLMEALNSIGWGKEKIMDTTYSYLMSNSKSKKPEEGMLNSIIDDDENTLFAFKIEIFDNKELTLSKEAKKAIRKSSTILECCSVLYSLNA